MSWHSAWHIANAQETLAIEDNWRVGFKTSEGVGGFADALAALLSGSLRMASGSSVWVSTFQPGPQVRPRSQRAGEEWVEMKA